jgi:hypothetical protein
MKAIVINWNHGTERYFKELNIYLKQIIVCVFKKENMTI